ncbi:hypothetical protein ORJ66_05850 [Pseudoalteromonas tunicata]|uniref:hypothetical protein n=1 Tax=Pseudoalteromonas tunicata TaxID=314281 RepID=UPI00273F30B8|nr:hypothetical protein [Pseudoalteromonas tunicata]MDP5212562.1 hypothetical protein [Pseudoalteromonas tunicata]
MKNITFEIYHPDLDIVSDRTLRSILKKFSSLLREIQYQEVFHFINSSDLSPSQKQSLRDRLKGPLNHIDAYYVERIEKGSILIVGALTATGLWLLKNTIGESIKEAWKQSEMHSNLVDYLSKPKVRDEVVDRCIDRVFDAWNFEGFVIESIEKEKVGENGEDLKVRINLDTDPILKQHVKENVHEVNVEFLLQELEKEIIRLKTEDF